MFRSFGIDGAQLQLQKHRKSAFLGILLLPYVMTIVHWQPPFSYRTYFDDFAFLVSLRMPAFTKSDLVGLLIR